MILSFDIETSHLDPKKGDIVSMQYQIEDEGGVHDPVYIDCQRTDWDMMTTYVVQWLSNPDIKKIIHNASFEYSWILEKYGVKIQNFEDTMLLPFILDAGVPFKYTGVSALDNMNKLHSVALKHMVEHYFKSDISAKEIFDELGTKSDKGIVRVIKALFYDTETPLTEIFKGKGKKIKEYNLDRVELYRLFQIYAKDDVVFALKLWHKFEAHAQVEAYRNELRLIPHLHAMKQRGILIDQAYFQTIRDRYETTIQDTVAKMRELVGDPEFTPSRREVLADTLVKRGAVLPTSVKGKTLTNKSTLKAVKDELCPLVEAYNNAMAFNTQHVGGILNGLDEYGVLHPNYLSAGTVHGRFASRAPNLMNLPKKDIRRGLIARPGYKFYFFDYSQIELRWAAIYLSDKLWLSEYNNTERKADLHTQTAQICFGMNTITEKQRDFGKKFNFAILYGAGKRKIASLLVEIFGGTDAEHLDKATEIHRKFHEAHPSLRQFMNKVTDRLMTDEMKYAHFVQYMGWKGVPPRKVEYRGYVQNMYGRQYRVPENVQYKLLEYLTSGHATGDMNKEKLCEVSEYLQEFNSKVVGDTHDEIIVEVCEAEASVVVPRIQSIMEDVPKAAGRLPIKVDVECGYNWEEKENYELA